MRRLQDLTVIKTDLSEGIGSKYFHNGTDTVQYSTLDNGTHMFMTLPVCEWHSIPI